MTTVDHDVDVGDVGDVGDIGDVGDVGAKTLIAGSIFSSEALSSRYQVLPCQNRACSLWMKLTPGQRSFKNASIIIIRDKP